MATDSDFIEYIHEQVGLGGRLTHKRMFGEYALYLDEKVVAFACDNSLLLKPTAQGRALLPRLTLGKPYPEAKDYYVLDEFLDDTDLLRQFLQATADALPAPKPKASKAGRLAGRRMAGKDKDADATRTVKKPVAAGGRAMASGTKAGGDTVAAKKAKTAPAEPRSKAAAGKPAKPEKRTRKATRRTRT